MDEHIHRYLEEPRCAVIATIGHDGAPHQAVVHYFVEPDGLLINGRADRRWVVNLRRDPRASVIVHDAQEPLHWVGIKGRAELVQEGRDAVEAAMALARRYGEDPSGYEGQERLGFRVPAQRVFENRD